VHTIWDDPEGSDIILFSECHLIADWQLKAIVDSSLVRQCHQRCYVYDERDRPWCALPGVFVSMPKSSFRLEFQRACGYYCVDEPFTRLGLTKPPDDEPDLLMSLAATRSHPCRNPLFSLVHPRAVIEEPAGFVFYDPSSPGFSERRSRFAELLYRSNFVLCPRGKGTSSIRLYETMAAGRVPVIIADDWVAPVGPAWDTFAIRWPEGNADSLISHLEALEPDAERMGAAARRAFVEFFAPDVSFHRIAEALGELHAANAARSFPRKGLRGRVYWESRLAVGAGRARARLGAVKNSLKR